MHKAQCSKQADREKVPYTLEIVILWVCDELLSISASQFCMYRDICQTTDEISVI